MTGIDTERVVNKTLLESQLKEMVCCLCMDLIRPSFGRQAPCGHIFCSDCILKSIEATGPTCPIDRTPVVKEKLPFLREANPTVYRMIGSIQIKCKHFKEGCTWTGDVTEDEGHLKNCSFPTEHCQCCKKWRAELKKSLGLIEAYRKLDAAYSQRVAYLEERLKIETNQNSRGESSLSERPQGSGSSAQVPYSLQQGVKISPNQVASQSEPSVTNRIKTSLLRNAPTNLPLNSGIRPQIRASSQPWKEGILLRTLAGKNPGKILSMDFSSDGYLFAGNSLGFVEIWKSETLVDTLDHGRFPVNKVVCFGTSLFTCCGDKSIRMWSKRGEKWVFDQLLKAGAEFKNCVPEKMAVVKNEVFVGFPGGGICVFRDKIMADSCFTVGNCTSQLDIAASPDGTVYFSGKLDFGIMVYKEGKVIGLLNGHESTVVSLSVSNNGTLFSYSSDHSLGIWSNLNLLTIYKEIPVQGGFLAGPDDVLYAGHPKEDTVGCWKEGECVTVLSGCGGLITSLAFTHGCLYGGDANGCIRVWKGVS